jgi:Ca-activated chloride channel homolog
VYILEYPCLLAVAILPVLIWMALPKYQEEQSSVRFPFFDQATKAAGVKPSTGAIVPRATLPWKVLLPVAWLLAVLALARPVYVEPPIQKVQPTRDLMLALDISQSMDSRDFTAPDGKRLARIDAVKHVVDGFIQRRKGDRIGIIVFGAAAYPQAPFTLDHRTCRALLQETESGMAGPQTMIGDAIGLAIKEFGNSKAPDKVLVLLTDGNDTGSRMPPAKAAEIAKQKGIKIHVVAIGDPKATGEDKVDVPLMRTIAESTGGRFFLGQDQKQLENAYSVLDAITPQNFKTLSYRPKHQLFLYPLGASALLLVGFQIVMLIWSLIRYWTSRSRGAASPLLAKPARL